MNKKIKLAISIVTVLFIASASWYMSYPEQKEPVEVGFSNAWPVEKADIGIKIQDELVEGIPVINFEYNNRNYTTLREGEGLTIEPKEESFNDLLKYVENGSISQAHATAPGSKVYAVYVLIDNKQAYFSTEKLIDVDHICHGITLEKKNKDKTIVCFDQKILFTIIATILFTIIGFLIVLVTLWTKPKNSEKIS